ncbi:hypothetical protein ymoll0001_38240 [Yersinia mollaretii ATCC 43969]|uniref:Uncharacterized protein n=1 Tax=Yersinia mollaretii (strain ATCC 43969 / DSM 18520 / CIP 103324 / CNY 7263 / WAIP 204) TaxID=349967 RepID=A0ABP2E8V1_YERMW|nr:hypothetical protein [Yersinia mollaretii]EEQ08851.1 hypothetical protein ymoll0001_38240 [Yersinia mollaretii ATCC 43969]QKJ02315.1 hypothetical protein HRD69_04525 [Yersinia mollaretii ATCC 43969]
MNIINDHVENVNPDIGSITLPIEIPAIKMNEGQLERILSDLNKIRGNDKSVIGQLPGSYQENSDGTFHSYSIEEMKVGSTNKMKIYVEAEYSAGNISGYTIKYTESDMTGNILGSVESKLDADGTTIDLPNDDPAVGLNKTESEVVPQVVTNPPEGEVAPQVVTNPPEGEVAPQVVTNPPEGEIVPKVVTNPSEGEIVPQTVTDPSEGEIVPQTVTDPSAGKENQLIESINSFPLYGEDVVSVLLASNIMAGAALVSAVICMP